MRVLHVAQPTTAGVARVVADLVADQVARGWQVHVACPDGGSLTDDVERSGARRHRWVAGRAPSHRVWRETRALATVLREVRPDVVHLHSSKAGLCGRLALRGHAPTVFQPHAWSFLAADGPTSWAAVRWERTAVRWTDAVAVVSEQELAAGRAAGIRASYRLVPNGVDVARRIRAAERGRETARAELGLAPAQWVVCPGRLCAQKGQDLLLRAWPRIVEAVPGARLAFVGDGPDAAALAASAPGEVVFAGDSVDLDPWLVAADVVALPSRWEAGSLVVLEAMAVGRSIVAGAADGMAEALGGVAGSVVDAADSAAFADAVVRRLTDADLRRAEEEAGRNRAASTYDLSQSTARVAALYPELRRR